LRAANLTMINTATNSLQPISQNHQSDNSSSANETSSFEANTRTTESKSRINNGSFPAEATSNDTTYTLTNRLNSKHLEECCQKRDLNPDWAKANCSSINQKQATEFLRYSAKSSGILIEGANGQYQFKSDKPWANKQGKKAPKYRTAAGDEYDALLPQHPTEPNYWLDTEKLKQRCYQINGHPMLLITEGGFKAIAPCSHDIPTIALLGVEMGLTSTKDDPQGKRYLVPELECYAKKGFGFILAFDCDTYTKKPVIQALIKLASQLQKFSVPVYTLPKWNESEGKGIDDYIQKNGIEAFRKKLLSQAVSFEQWQTEYGQNAFDREGLTRLDTAALLNHVRTKYRDRLRLNKLQQKVELDGAEILIEEAYLWLAEHDNIDCSKTKAGDIFFKVASENSFNPVVNYLNTVAKTVKPASLDTLSQKYFKTNDPLYDVFLKRTLIAAVARAYNPGCKHDTALVLQGEQGIRKSTFFNVLGGQWFDDSMGDGRNKDDLIILHKSWIQEWGEIERVFGKRQAGEIKAFLVRKKDIFRPPYGRTALEFPRHGIIVGTVNGNQFLVDPTGDRRYQVIPIKTNKIDIKRLEQERDSIWSAAVHAYRKGEQWWLTDSEQKLSNENNQQFRSVDEWESAIANYLENRGQVSVTQILQDLFDFELGKIDRSSQMRVSNVLTSLNWKKVGQKQHQGKRQVVWHSAIPERASIVEVLQSEIQLEQGLSIPTIPAIPFSEKVESKDNFLNSDSEKNLTKGSNKKLEKTGVAGVENLENSVTARDSDSYTSATPSEPTIPWQSYPYSSKDVYTLRNRANKVKERVLNCTTNNELITLYAEGKVSQAEIDWLKSNLLTTTEYHQLDAVEKTRQPNLLIENNELKKQITAEVKRIGWSKEKAIKYIQEKYSCSHRQEMTNEQLIEFYQYLQRLPIAQSGGNSVEKNKF
jgi:predicted P-loop ATPase